MSSLGKTAITEMISVVEGKKTHTEFVDFFMRVKGTFEALKASGNIDEEDGKAFKLSVLLAGNPDLIKDRAFTNKLV